MEPTINASSISNTSPIIHASCSCGEVEFAARTAPLVQFVCHCTDCQSASGKAFVELVFFKLKHTSITGDLTRRDFVADSGKVTQRQLCSYCGDLMFDQSEGFPGIIGVMRERISGDFTFAPQCHVWVQSKRAGVVIPEDIAQFQQSQQF